MDKQKHVHAPTKGAAIRCPQLYATRDGLPVSAGAFTWDDCATTWVAAIHSHVAGLVTATWEIRTCPILG